MERGNLGVVSLEVREVEVVGKRLLGSRKPHRLEKRLSRSITTLLLALDSARFEFTLKMRLNRKMPERPNICYIFEKLGVQGCQI